MTYNGGSIQQTPIVYTIFWNPHGTISPGYESLINRYFQDIGGSDFYNVVTQYYQLPGPVYMQNLSSLGGTFVDSAPYPGGRGTTTRPISDQDIENEVTRALSLNPSWPTPSIGSEYFVYTEPGIESCYDPSAPHSDLSCTPGIASPYGYCAYHSAFGTISQPVIYANMPYDETWTTSCRTFSQSPNGNLAADSDISTSSHEHFEIANDPLLDAWYDPSGAEIGDKCAYRYGTTQADGRNLTLNGNPYIIQLEWSNANNDGVTPYSGCVSSYGGATVTPSPTASSTPSPTPTPTPTPTASPTPTPTASPTPTPTPSPTPTPTASPTPTPTPVPTPSPTPLDSDADGVPDASDNCPNWPNQAQNLPVWPVPPGDSDCDGFPDRVAIGAPNPLAAEAFTGTDPASHCASTSARNDEPLPDRWPVDLDDNQLVNGQDLLQFSPVFAAIAPDPRYNVRFDLNEDGRINGADLLKFSPFFVKHCA